jgi:hypothetical protein
MTTKGEWENIWKDAAVVACLQVGLLYQHSNVGAEEDHEETQTKLKPKQIDNI